MIPGVAVYFRVLGLLAFRFFLSEERGSGAETALHGAYNAFEEKLLRVPVPAMGGARV